MESSISSKNWTKTCHILVRMNSFVRFLEEFTAWQFAFEINWPLAMYFISIGAWWMICLHSTISHAHKRYHLTIQNWYYSICSIVILDHIFVEFFWLAAAAVICHHWSVEKEQKKRLVDNILKSKSGVQILCRECRMRRFIWVLHIPNCKPICIFLQQSYLFNNVRIFSDIST